MEAKIHALEKNHTWRLAPLPARKRTIGCKWVFKTKLRADGSVEGCRAGLVAKGYNQIEGIDYTNGFPPAAKAVVVRLFLTLIAANGWEFYQLDVNNAFLHGYLDEDIYITPPDGYQVEPDLISKLERSLYELKQASCQWNVELTVKLQEYRFIPSAHGHCLFTLHTARDFTRPDISHSVQQLSQFLNRPCEAHWSAALHVVRYLKRCPSKGLFLPAANSLVLKGYCNAEWPSCTYSRRSLIGFCIFLSDAIVS
ncbi:UNVERIFIED_CONTAM: putative mitochondrial protein [Sesamum radiatum]|uniref:Mitochondrial protein n=1 Tax=Sesamum radiatum TaxID=300843 RepID=A0AAW2T576_SESRA